MQVKRLAHVDTGQMNTLFGLADKVVVGGVVARLWKKVAFEEIKKKKLSILHICKIE